MATEYAFVEGVDPESVKARELAISQRKSIAARNAHLRRRTRIIQVLADFQMPPESVSFDQTGSSSDGSRTFQFSNITQDSYRARKAMQSAKPDPRSGRKLKQHLLPPGATKIESPEQRPTLLYLPMLSQPTGQLHMTLTREIDRRTFAFWRDQTATMVVRYSPKFADVWYRMVPNIALEYPAVRHMLLAHSHAHERLSMNADVDSQQPSHQELLHYAAGIKAMSSGPGTLVFLAAAMLAFCYEAMNNDYQTAMVHLQGCQALLDQGSLTDSDEVKGLKSYLTMLTKGTLGFNPPPKSEDTQQAREGEFFFRDRDKEQSFTTVLEARDSILQILERAAMFDEETEDVEDFRLELAQWFFTVRNWDLRGPMTLDRDVLMLFFNLSVSQSPDLIAPGMSMQSSTENQLLVLQDIRRYLSPDHLAKAIIEDMRFVLETLSLLCQHIQKVATNPNIYEDAEQLLDQIRQRQKVKSTWTSRT